MTSVFNYDPLRPPLCLLLMIFFNVFHCWVFGSSWPAFMDYSAPTLGGLRFIQTLSWSPVKCSWFQEPISLFISHGIILQTLMPLCPLLVRGCNHQLGTTDRLESFCLTFCKIYTKKWKPLRTYQKVSNEMKLVSGTRLFVYPSWDIALGPGGKTACLWCVWVPDLGSK